MYPAPVFMDFSDKSANVLFESHCRTYLDEILNIAVHKTQNTICYLGIVTRSNASNKFHGFYFTNIDVSIL